MDPRSAGSPWTEMRRLQHQMEHLFSGLSPALVQVPGFEPSELDVTVGRRTLTIRGEHNQGGEQRRFVQRVTLPDAVDVERAEARVERGVLTVRFPRTAPAPAGRRIQVSR